MFTAPDFAPFAFPVTIEKEMESSGCFPGIALFGKET